MGRIIPAGTGMSQYRGARFVLEQEDAEAEPWETVDDSAVDQADEAVQA
jgi:hypothetical protein